MTMPTESVSASIVIMLSVKPMYQIRPKVAMIEVGMAIAAMIVERRFARNSSTTSAARIEPTIEVLLDVVDRRFDEVGRVADDAQRRSRAAAPPCSSSSRSLTAVDDLDGVGARLPADLQEHRAGAVDVGDGVGIGLAVFDARDVGDPDRVAVLLADDDVVELGDGLDAAARAQRDRLRPLIDAAAGDLDVLRLQRARDVGDRQVVGAQAVGVEPDVDLPLAAAEDEHLADAVDAFELPAQHLVGVLGDVADRLVGAEREAQDRRRVGIELVDARLLNRLRQQRQDAVDLVAHFLRGDVGVLVEQEADDDLRDAFGRDRAQLVDAADGVDRFLDLVGDLGLDLLRRGAGLDRRDDDGREVDLREAIDAEAREREDADDGQRQDQDGREDRTFDAERSKPLHDH